MSLGNGILEHDGKIDCLPKCDVCARNVWNEILMHYDTWRSSITLALGC
jgi:hypothetical protein